MEAGKCDAIAILVHLEQRHRTGTDKWSVAQEYVCDGAVLHHDVHDFGEYYAAERCFCKHTVLYLNQ